MGPRVCPYILKPAREAGGLPSGVAPIITSSRPFTREIGRRLDWIGGTVNVTHVHRKELSSYDTVYTQSTALFVLRGKADVAERTIDGSTSKRGPCRAGEVNFFRAGCAVTGRSIGRLEYVKIHLNEDSSHHFVDLAHTIARSDPWLCAPMDAPTKAVAEELAAQVCTEAPIDDLLVDGACGYSRRNFTDSC
jgi:hypothetical protein